MERYAMTPLGYDRLKSELDQLKNVDRPRNIKAIDEARGHGDLSENADYDSAKQEQGLIAARIALLEDKFARAEVIDPKSLEGPVIMFGATVSLVDLQSDDKIVYKLVSSYESDIKQKLISIESPIGKALVGRGEGDEVSVATPNGKREFAVEKVTYK